MRKFIFIIILLVLLAGFSGVMMMYKRVLANNVSIPSGEYTEFYIFSGWTYDSVFSSLKSLQILIDPESFDWVARRKNYPRHLYPGRYIIRDSMSNNELVGMLRSGVQEPVQLVFNNIRTTEKLASVISTQIEADSNAILALFGNRELIDSLGFTRETILGVFIPNTYEIYWNTSAEKLLVRMVREYRKFWNESRLDKAKQIGLEPLEVITLASIVDEECLYDKELDRIAGLYMNRLHKHIRLQADPTVKFAAGDMNMTRVLKKYLEIDSPYNTYRRAGLPPGPIVIPSISAIDAVLNYERHNYLYMCAKEDFSGYHNFATTLDQHAKNARSYQNALNRRKIFN